MRVTALFHHKTVFKQSDLKRVWIKEGQHKKSVIIEPESNV